MNFFVLKFHNPIDFINYYNIISIISHVVFVIILFSAIDLLWELLKLPTTGAIQSCNQEKSIHISKTMIFYVLKVYNPIDFIKIISHVVFVIILFSALDLPTTGVSSKSLPVKTILLFSKSAKIWPSKSIFYIKKSSEFVWFIFN